MPLDPSIARRIRDEATRRGADPSRAIAHAEKVAAEKALAGPSDDGGGKESRGKLVDKLLVGHLPFVKVRELRNLLGLVERIPDDEMTCGAFAAKYGGAAAAPADDGPPA